MLIQILDLVGSAMLIVLVAYIVVDIFTTKRIQLQALIGRIIFLIFLFILLLRT